MERDYFQIDGNLKRGKVSTKKQVIRLQRGYNRGK